MGRTPLYRMDGMDRIRMQSFIPVWESQLTTNHTKDTKKGQEAGDKGARDRGKTIKTCTRKRQKRGKGFGRM
jgi:hypothetical protein